MDIRDLSLLERVPSLMDELAEVCKKEGQIGRLCHHLAADVRRKANALKDSLTRLKEALEKADGPPLSFLADRPPLWSRLQDCPELRRMAAFVGHYGVSQAEFETLMKTLREEFGVNRACDAMMELTQSDVVKQWVTMRPSVLRACRVVMGPPPGDPDYALYWSTRGGPPRPRSPDDPRPVPEPPREEVPREQPPEEKTEPKKRAKKKKEET